MSAAQPAVYRPADSESWQDAEIVGRHTDGRLILREVGKVWPGICLASLDRVRVQGRVFEFREPCGIERNELRAASHVTGGLCVAQGAA